MIKDYKLHYPYVVREMPIAELPKTLARVLRLHDAKKEAIQAILAGLVENLVIEIDEAWDEVAQAFGYTSYLDRERAGQIFEIDWMRRVVRLRAETEPKPPKDAAENQDDQRI